METRRGEVITRQEIDAMDEEELLALVRRHANLLGERFPKKRDQFYCPDILDEPHLLRKLYRLDREQFIGMVLEQNKREYISGGRWAAVLLSQGETLPEEVLCRQEQVMSKTLTRVEEHTCTNGRGYEWNETLEHTTALAIESALFLEVSEQARRLWQEHRYFYRKTRCDQLSQAMALREFWLGASHTDSARVFYELGWPPLDVMLSFLLASPYRPAVDPDCAADAARRDPETAAKLMNQDNYKQYLGDRLHPSYFADMARTWRDVLYLQYRWPDLAPLERGQRLKKADAHCKLVLGRLRDPEWPRREFERNLEKAGLLPSKVPLDWDSPKLAKLQRLTLTKAMICHYQWGTADLRSTLAASPKPELFTALVWGLYQENRLEAVFLLDRDGTAWGEDGERLTLPENARIGLVVPAELTEKQRKTWKKRLKEAGGKPPIRQLAIQPQPPEWERFEGAVTKHITIYTAAGKWGLDMGDLRPAHCRADLLDPLHGYGARIGFEQVWNGPEYSEKDVSVSGVVFFRLDPLPFDDCLPQRSKVSPQELPARFACLAGAAFRQLAGLK